MTQNLLAGKNLLITGLLTDQSLAFSVARLAQAQGATVILSTFGRRRILTERAARNLAEMPPVLELDVTSASDLAALSNRLSSHVNQLDGIVHSISGGSSGLMGGKFLDAEWPEISAALQASAFSLKALSTAALPMLSRGASIVGTTFDGSHSWPIHDWMGVGKATYESVSRYLARYLGPSGIRCNLVSGAPTISPGTSGIPGFSDAQERLESFIEQRAPLGWDLYTSEPTARAIVALLSDWFPATTGEIVHVDGGIHSTGG